MTLASQIASGAAWTVSLRLAVRGVGLVSTLILVRLLVPSDFGIVAMATSICAVIELLTAFGFEVVLIQNQESGPEEYNAAWTLNALLGVAASGALVLLAFPAAAFYEEPKLAPVIMVLALSALLQGFQNVGLVDFRKHFLFHKEFIFQLAVKFCAFVVTVSLAFAYRSYWALVAGMVASKFVGLVVSYLIHPFRPRPSLAAIQPIFQFSKWMFVQNVTYFFRLRSPDFILGKISGPASLGVFSVAYEISNLPSTELIAPINRALLPGLSKMAPGSERMARGVARAAATVALLSLPAGFGIAAIAELLVPVLLGDHWLSATPLIQLLALLGAVNAVQSTVGTALLAAGRPAVLAFLSLSLITVMVPTAMYFTAVAGPLGMAKALFGTALLFLPLTYGVASRVIGLTLADIKRIFVRPLLAAGVMFFAVTRFIAFAKTDGSFTDETLLLFAAVALGAVVYGGVIATTWLIGGRPDGAERFVLELLSERVRWIIARASR